jgi:hypothetical protein
MRLLALMLSAVTLACAGDSITALGYTWDVPNKAEWSAAEGLLKMLVPFPDPKPVPRRPAQYALAQTAPFEEVRIDVEVKRLEKGSLIIVYAWRDAEHFNYIHLSPDLPSKQPVHSGIFHVYKGDRVRISSTEGPATLPAAGEWTPVRVTYSAKTHLCEATVNGQKIPSLRAADFSLGAGRVGLGSFFNLAEFRKLRIEGR